MSEPRDVEEIDKDIEATKRDIELLKNQLNRYRREKEHARVGQVPPDDK